MRLLSVCIYFGILLFLVDLSFAKRRDQNAIDVLEELNAQDEQESDEDADIPKKKKNTKKSQKKKSDEDYDDEDEFLYACLKNDKDSVCKCDVDTLNCENNDLKETDIYIRDESFIVKTANFKNNGIKVLRNKFILPGLDYEVEVLDFSNNKIFKIEDKCFNAFDSLKKLYLSSNNLRTISNGFLTKKIGDSLHQLFLDDNKIVKIHPSTFEELKNLTKLVLDGNVGIQLSKNTFPTALAKLEILSLDRCNISKLEDNVFENLLSLKQLSLTNNPITSIPKALNGIPNLFALALSNTEICELDTDQISSDHNLTEIYLSNITCLYGILDCAFCGLPNLQKIILSNNSQLYDLNENAFGSVNGEKNGKSPVATLKEFDIQNCNFSTLPQKLFDWTTIGVLKISGNPFDCTCDLAWLVNDKNIHFDSNPKCGAPPSLNGTYFSKLSDSVCDGKTSASSGSSSVLWAFALFLTVVGLVGGFLLYTRRVRVTNILYRPEVPQMGYSNLTTEQHHPSQHEDEEELQGDFQPRSDAIPV
uniref:LRRCT domain-containing protein n=1 Tax=Panagrolaimus sp. ES5 TaxID=591445 RepID=A0AC34GR30_9BILA